MNQGVSMVETLRDFVTKVDQLGIKYMVTGSYAMSVYGEIRMTKDIDVVVQFSQSDLVPFFNSFKDEYYISDESMRYALTHRKIFNIISHSHGGKIDCIIPRDTDFARASFARRYKETVSGIEFWTTTREDLIIAKLSWARDSHSEMQIRDIANLTGSEYDSAYVEDWIARLGLEEIWAEVAQWKTQHKSPNN